MDTQLTYVHIESSTYCNAKCKMCPQSQIRRRGRMDYRLFTSIVDQAMDEGCDSFTLFRLGEPLLFQDLFKWMDYLKEKGAKVSLYTNASHLVEPVGRMLQEYRDIFCDFTISFHGADAASYNDTMGLDFDATYSNIEAFMKYNEVPINIYMLANDPSDRELQTKFKGLWDGMGFKGMALCHYMEWAGNIKGFRTLRTMWKEEGQDAEMEPCFRILHEIDVMNDGTVVLCCVDAHGEITFGNLNQLSLKEVLDHKLRRYYQNEHCDANSEKLPLCRECSTKLRLI